MEQFRILQIPPENRPTNGMEGCGKKEKEKRKEKKGKPIVTRSC
jgi:hypothetical protein